MNASSLVLKHTMIETRLGSIWASSFWPRSLSMSTTIEMGYASLIMRSIFCSTLSSSMRNSSFFRSATRLPARSFTVTGTTTVSTVVRMVGASVGLAWGFGGVCWLGAGGVGVGFCACTTRDANAIADVSAKAAVFLGLFIAIQ